MLLEEIPKNVKIISNNFTNNNIVNKIENKNNIINNRAMNNNKFRYLFNTPNNNNILRCTFMTFGL